MKPGIPDEIIVSRAFSMIGEFQHDPKTPKAFACCSFSLVHGARCSYRIYSQLAAPRDTQHLLEFAKNTKNCLDEKYIIWTFFKFRLYIYY